MMKPSNLYIFLILLRKFHFSLDKPIFFCYNVLAFWKCDTIKAYRDVAQLVARMVWDHDAAGSNPVISTT